MKFFVVLLVALLALLAVSDASKMFCQTCENIVTAGENGGEQALEQEADKECAKLGVFASMCTEFVNSEIEDVMKMLENKETPEQICKKIHMC